MQRRDGQPSILDAAQKQQKRQKQAAQAAAAEPSVNPDHECPICLGVFYNPVATGCAGSHKACLHCIRKYALEQQKQHEQSSNGYGQAWKVQTMPCMSCRLPCQSLSFRVDEGFDSAMKQLYPLAWAEQQRERALRAGGGMQRQSSVGTLPTCSDCNGTTEVKGPIRKAGPTQGKFYVACTGGIQCRNGFWAGCFKSKRDANEQVRKGKLDANWERNPNWELYDPRTEQAGRRGGVFVMLRWKGAPVSTVGGGGRGAAIGF